MKKTRLHGEGCIYPDGKGYWVAEISLGKDINGKRLRARKKSKTQKQALKELAKLQGQKHTGSMLKSENLNFTDVYKEWLEKKRESNVRESTINNYEYLVTKYVLPQFGKSKITQIEQESISKWVLAMKQQGYSVNTIKRAKQTINAICDYALRTRRIPFNPCLGVSVPRYPDDAPSSVREPLNLDEARHVISLAAGSELETILTLALLLGLRRGEIIGLKWTDIDNESQIVRIQRSVIEGTRLTPDGTGLTRIMTNPPKTKTSARTLKLSGQVLDSLERQRKRQAKDKLAAGPNYRDDGFMFATKAGGVIFPTNVGTRVSKLLKKNNLRHIRFHDLRHTAAVLMLTAGARLEEVSQALGHSSIQITKDTYAPYVQTLADNATSAISILFESSVATSRLKVSGENDFGFDTTQPWSRPER